MAKIMLDTLPTISETIAEHGLNAKKSLGQNFILDLNLTKKIARQGLPFSSHELIMEIGPGPGALTRGILFHNPEQVIAVEKDQRCYEALQDLIVAANNALTIIQQDALTLSLESVLRPHKQEKVKIIANLPYNISTTLLVNWLEERHFISGMVLMFQKEVAQRLCASPSHKSYGRLSVLTQLCFDAKIAFDVPPQAFKPAPKVTSSIVVLKPKAKPILNLEDKNNGDDSLWSVIKMISKQAFAQRRKMLRKTLKTYFPNIDEILEHLNLPNTVRAEDLSPHDYVILAQHYKPSTS